jgi:PAS domain S-box-containing protein
MGTREMRFKAIFDSTFQFIGLLKPDGTLLEANASSLNFAGITLEMIVNKPLWDAHWWSGNADRVRELKSAIERAALGTFVRYEVEIQGAGDKTVIIDFSLTPIFSTDKKVEFLVPEGRDITERIEDEKLLSQRESYLVAIIENQPGMIWLKDPEGKFLMVNHAFAKSCGLLLPEKVLGKKDIDIWPLELAEKYLKDDAECMISRKSIVVEEQIFDQGEMRWYETFKTPIISRTGDVIGTSGFSREITDRKRTEEALQRSQKLDSLGILASGIAHDFNNLLVGIFGYIDMARSLSNDPTLSEYLDKSLNTIGRARGLTSQLLTFAKGGTPVRKSNSLIPFIQETAQFALSGSSVSCAFSFPENLKSCNFDRNQISQVIDNILINAQQAMPMGGTIEISAKNIFFQEKEHPPLNRGDYVRISIKDHGIGISKEILPNIFDPFFTTKTQGHGLGLSTCYSILSRHEGAIEVESEQGQGSTFFLYLPVSLDHASMPMEESSAVHKGSGKILVMDDEAVIRDTLGEMLENMGYQVVLKKDGNEALNFLLEEMNAKRELTAVFLDLTVPGGVGGDKIIEEIRKVNKKIPVFVVSGYSNDPIMSNPGNFGFTASIPKPFMIAEVSRILNRYMDNAH